MDHFKVLQKILDNRVGLLNLPQTPARPNLSQKPFHIKPSLRTGCIKKNEQPSLLNISATKYSIVQLGLDFKLNTKIGLDTTHPPQTFRPLPGLLGG